MRNEDQVEDAFRQEIRDDAERARGERREEVATRTLNARLAQGLAPGPKVCSQCGRGGSITRGMCVAHYFRWRRSQPRAGQ